MLSEALLYRRESLEISIVDLCKLTGISIEEYRLLENPSSHKMSIQTFEKLDAVMNLGEEFRKQYVTPYLRFGDTLKAKRIEKGFSLVELSKRTGIRRNYLWNLENQDKKKLSIKMFEKLRIALEIDDIENFEPFLLRPGTAKIKFVNDGFFGELVLKNRTNKLLSQREVAMMANIDFSLISKLEIGARVSMTTKNAIKLMNALDFTEEEKGRYLIKK